MNPEKETYELSEWVKLVKRILGGTRKWEEAYKHQISGNAFVTIFYIL